MGHSHLAPVQEEPTAWDEQFSRGMDPHVLDPARCHAHPPPPPRWPSREELVARARALRERLLPAAQAGALPMHSLVRGPGVAGCRPPPPPTTTTLAPAPWLARQGLQRVSGALESPLPLPACPPQVMVLEHAHQHQETLCYLLAQQRRLDVCAAEERAPVVVCQPAAVTQGTSPAASQTFYLAQCSYASASLEQPGAGGSAANGDLAPHTPVRRSEGLLGTLRSLLTRAPAGAAAPPTPAFVRVPGRQVRARPDRRRVARCCECAATAPAHMVRALSGVPQVTLGLERASVEHSFHWDNELGVRGPEAVPDLLVGQRPVSVAQYRHFVLHDKVGGQPAVFSRLPSKRLLRCSAAAAPRCGAPPLPAPVQAYERRDLWDHRAWEHLRASGRRLPATWSVASGSTGGDLLVHMPEASYAWEEVADCPVYVRRVRGSWRCSAPLPRPPRGEPSCRLLLQRSGRAAAPLTPPPCCSLAEAQAYCRLHGGRVMSEAEWVHLAGSAAARGGEVAHLACDGWEWTCTEFAPFEGAGPCMSALRGCGSAEATACSLCPACLLRRLCSRPALPRVLSGKAPLHAPALPPAVSA